MTDSRALEQRKPKILFKKNWVIFYQNYGNKQFSYKQIHVYQC